MLMKSVSFRARYNSIFLFHTEKKMEERDPHLINYNESVGWKDAFRLHPSPLTPGKPLRKVMIVKMDIPKGKSVTFWGGTNGTYVLSVSDKLGTSHRDHYYISDLGKIVPINVKITSFVKKGNGSYVFTDKNEDIYLLDTENKDSIIKTNFNKINDGISLILITDYGEFAYVKNGILSIPNRNLSIKIHGFIFSIGLNYYTSYSYKATTKSHHYDSYSLYNESVIIPDTLVYKDKILQDPTSILGINDKFYYKKGLFESPKVFSLADDSFMGYFDMVKLLPRGELRWGNTEINFEYTQVVRYGHTDKGFVINIYQH